MATHSSVLAWRIPGMGEPGGLPSMGSHRVGHDWSYLAAAAARGLRREIKKQKDNYINGKRHKKHKYPKGTHMRKHSCPQKTEMLYFHRNGMIYFFTL